jgi:peptidoglycan/LPS O-acetylase OafA/YrhL
VGCLLARYRSALWTWAPARRVLVSHAAGWWPVAMLAVAAINVRWPLFDAALGVSLLNVVIALGIERSVSLPQAGIGPLLNARPLALVGTWSYSLYLWQQPFLAEHASLALPVRVAALVACAVASYYVVERPALRLRARLERQWFARPTLTVRRVDTEVPLLTTLTTVDIATVRPAMVPPAPTAPSPLLYADRRPTEVESDLS